LDLTRIAGVARRSVEAAARASLPHFRRDLQVDWKPDRSPVTAADRDAERAILEVIGAAFPTHAVLAEESGTRAGDDGCRWIVDPLDGTRGFARGGSFWGPLVAFEHDGEVVAGAMALPALGEVYWAARRLGAWGPAGPLRVSGISSWSEATFSVGELRTCLAPPLGPRVSALCTDAAQARCHGDLAGCAMLLAGRAEAWMECGAQLWDLAPLKILVEEAGGRFTDLDDRPVAHAPCVVATNGRVHAHVLAGLKG
jgi:histidinol-phosphatase